MLVLAKSKVFLHHCSRYSRGNKLSIILRHYSREWDTWKRSNERTLFLQRNERRLVYGYT